jgi:hypothetical protein
MSSFPTKTLLFALFLSLIVISDAKLRIRSPDVLKEDPRFSPVNGIDYVVLTPQNKITYKRSFVGNALLASPNDDACEYVEAIPTYGDDAVYNPIVVASWGECHYAQKVKNAEIAGAKMLLLVLKHDMPINHPSIRQLPMTSNIEVLAISKKDGDNLITVLREAASKPKTDPLSVIELAYSYDPEKNVNYAKTEGKVSVDYWLTPTDTSKMSYEFLIDLESIMNDFNNAIKFTPHYVFWQNEALGRGGYQTDDERCVSGGRYCDPESKVDKRLFGKEAVLEALRQVCLRDLSSPITPRSEWWRYVNAYSTYCVDTDYTGTERCYEKVYSLSYIGVSIIDQVNKCMRDSFGVGIGANDNLGVLTADNAKLKTELALKDEMHVDHYPALYVNKERYTGSFRNRAQIVEFICSHFVLDTTPAVCLASTTQELTHTSRDTGVYLLIIIGSVIFMAIVLYCVRRGVKREVMVRMNDEISHIVTQYKQFKDKSNSSNVDDDL